MNFTSQRPQPSSVAVLNHIWSRHPRRPTQLDFTSSVPKLLGLTCSRSQRTERTAIDVAMTGRRPRLNERIRR